MKPSVKVFASMRLRDGARGLRELEFRMLHVLHACSIEKAMLHVLRDKSGTDCMLRTLRECRETKMLQACSMCSMRNSSSLSPLALSRSRMLAKTDFASTLRPRRSLSSEPLERRIEQAQKSKFLGGGGGYRF